MPALQRKRRLLMVKQRRLPLVAVVATRTFIPLLPKLVSMRILVAVHALQRCLVEPNVKHRLLHVRRTMAIDARYRTMRPFQRELRVRVIEVRKILPHLRLVTRLATHRLALGIQLRHPLRKLTLVNVLMACRAGQLRKVVRHHSLPRQRLVALVARHRNMTTRQRKVRLLVLRHRVVRCLERRPSVALLAPVVPRSTRKLPLMLVLMAVDAQRKLQTVAPRRPLRRVAVVALHLGMRRHQRKLRLRMIRHRVRRLVPVLHSVAALALPLIRPTRKLSAVNILVAIQALRMRDLRLEVPSLMASVAIHFQVLPKQRKIRLRMVKPIRKPRLRPTQRRVAGVTSRLELTLVRILVAIRTIRKLQPFVTWLPILTCRMALFARHALMQARQRKYRLRMVKRLQVKLRLLPVRRIVALRASRPKSPLVLVLMAINTTRLQSHVGVV